MSSVRTEAELLQCFREIDRADVDAHAIVLPPDSAPVVTWSSGTHAYLLLRDRADATPKGIVFHRNNGQAPTVPTMCQWCHRVRSNGGVKLLSVRSSDRRWVGQYLCSDLDCLRDDPAGPNDLRETLDTEARSARTIERIRSFAARRIF